MAFFKYKGKNTTRVLIPGQGKVDCKPGQVIEVDEKHKDFNEKMYTYGNFILTKMVVEKEKKETTKKTPKKD